MGQKSAWCLKLQKNLCARLPDTDLGKILVQGSEDAMHLSRLGSGKLLKSSHFWDSLF